jgi:hypothetical protein
MACKSNLRRVGPWTRNALFNEGQYREQIQLYRQLNSDRANGVR